MPWWFWTFVSFGIWFCIALGVVWLWSALDARIPQRRANRLLSYRDLVSIRTTIEAVPTTGTENTLPRHLRAHWLCGADQPAELPQDWNQGATCEPATDDSNGPPEHGDFLSQPNGWVLPPATLLYKHYLIVK